METLEQKYEHEKVGKLLLMFSVPSVISLVLHAKVFNFALKLVF